MTDREDFNGGRPVTQRPEWKPDVPKFRVKSETLGKDVVANFRVRPEVHEKLKALADANGVGIQDVVRQMIDFALENT